jgi:hypothetical protein
MQEFQVIGSWGSQQLPFFSERQIIQRPAALPSNRFHFELVCVWKNYSRL